MISARPLRDGVEGGELLEDAHRVVGAQHGDGGAEADALGAARDGGEHHLGGRDREVGAVVLADAEEVDPDPVGEHGLVDHVADHLGVRDVSPAAIDLDVTEGVEASSTGGV